MTSELDAASESTYPDNLKATFQENEGITYFGFSNLFSFDYITAETVPAAI